jgi:hypothetical protein
MDGRALFGALAGERLRFLPAGLVSWKEFHQAFPDAALLSPATGHLRPYGRNPYTGYDRSSRPFLFEGEPDRRLPAMERVVGLPPSGGRPPRAFPYAVLAEERVIQQAEVVIFWFPGTASAVDASTVEDGRDVGAAGAFRPSLNGRALTFRWQDGQVTDLETGSTWDVTGRATAGPLAGERLEPLIRVDAFWFAWAAFYPDTELHQR